MGNTTSDTKEIQLFKEVEVSPTSIEAQMAFANKEIPAHAVKTRAARGGKALSYVDHVFATEAIQSGLLPTWSYDVLGYEYHDDNSVTTRARFTDFLPYKDPVSGQMRFIERTLTEVGTYINDMKLPKASAIAAATSRNLVRCLMRLYGFGIQFYKDNEEVTPMQCWNTLKALGKSIKVSEDAMKEAIKKAGIEFDELPDRFTEAHEVVRSLEKSQDVKKTEPESAPAEDPGDEPAKEEVMDQATGEVPMPDDIEELAKGMKSWDNVTDWLKKMQVDPKPCGPLCQEKFGTFTKEKMPEYFKFLALQIDDLKAQYPLQ